MPPRPQPILRDDDGTPIKLGRSLIVSGEAKLFEREGYPDHVVKLHRSTSRAL